MKRRIALAALAVFLFAGMLLYVVPLFFPLPPGLALGPPSGVLFVDREDRPIRRMLDGELRADEPATFEEFPAALIEATLAAEDSRFFSHNGIDFFGILRAVRDAAVHREFVSGASTVTQQTVKLYSPPRKRDFQTKFTEIFTARKLEMFADKKTILTAYLNNLPYGNQFTGARAAARGYFGKPLADLSIAESALLAALPNKPTRLNPFHNEQGARKRQFWILGRMKEEKLITEAQFATALVEPLNLRKGVAQTFQAPHFVELVAQQIPDDEREGTIQTTLDLDLQDFVESTVAAELVRLAHESGESNDLQAAVVVIENETGEVLALTGSRSFFGSKSGQINGAWNPRSAGSTLKPFTYLLALERGHTAATVLADTPIEYVTSTGVYQPVNFHRRFNGPVSLRHALANSLNVPAVKTLNTIGGPDLLHRLFCNDLHFTSLDEDAVEYGLGLTLGNAEVRLLELTNAYACLARLGEYKPYRMTHPMSAIQSQGGAVSNRPRSEGSPDPAGSGGWKPPLPGTRSLDQSSQPMTQQGSVTDSTLLGTALLNRSLFDPSAAWLIADILSDKNARAATFGLHSPLNLPFRVAAKTGTSTDFRDNWTLGYTPDFTVGVWVGCFNNRPLDQISGAMGAAPIFRRVMIQLHEDKEPRWYDTPASAVRLTVDSLNGKKAGEGTKRRHEEWFIEGSLPEHPTDSDYDSSGKTTLPISYSNWWRSPANDLKDVAKLDSPAVQSQLPQFRIISPLEGTVAFLDPDLPRDGSRFPLRIAGSGQEEIEWFSDGLEIETDGENCWLKLSPGDHEIVARDRKSGRESRSRIEVQRL